ncbi:MAG: prepilin peptidase [Bryobacteraceae bacterium]
MHLPHPAIQAVLAALVIAAAAYDIRFRRIPNRLSLAGFLAGLAMNTAFGGWEGLKASAGGFALAFCGYLLLYLIHAMGAGDVKLMGAVGALAGASCWLYIFVVTAIFGGVAAVVLSLARGRLRRTLWNVGFVISELSHLRAPYLAREDLDVKSKKALTLPHGVSIAVGTLAVLAAGYLSR